MTEKLFDTLTWQEIINIQNKCKDGYVNLTTNEVDTVITEFTKWLNKHNFKIVQESE